MATLLPSRRGLALFLLVVLLGVFTPLAAFNRPAAAAAISPYDLIAAVNGLRAARGLSQLAVNSSLMASAQAHSNYQASIGNGTHVGPGGSHPIDRARAAGYGGGAYIAIAENITQNRENAPDILNKAIYQDWSDDLHMNTMLNTGLQHAGAGIAVANGMIYLTLDTGWVAGPASPTRAVSGTPPTQGPLPTQGPRPTAIPIVALITSTPRQDGSLVHVVGYGQVLVNIAAAYGVKPAEIAAWNAITPDAIYAGQRLLVRLPFTKTPPGFQAPAPAATASLRSSPTPTAASPSPDLPPSQTPTSLGALSAATPASIQVSPTAEPTAPAQQPSATEIAILVTIACGVLGIIGVSLRRK
jgi:LysM repeat protein